MIKKIAVFCLSFIFVTESIALESNVSFASSKGATSSNNFPILYNGDIKKYYINYGSITQKYNNIFSPYYQINKFENHNICFEAS